MSEQEYNACQELSIFVIYIWTCDTIQLTICSNTLLISLEGEVSYCATCLTQNFILVTFNMLAP